MKKQNNQNHKHHIKGGDTTDVADIIESVDIVDYISQYVELEKRSDEYWGLSPFTNEVTPSFAISGDIQRFYDFSSGHSGNILEFIKLYHHVGVYQAIKILKAYAGITDDISFPNVRLGCVGVAKRYRTRNQKIKAQRIYKNLGRDYLNRFEFNVEKLQPWIDEGISIDVLKKYSIRYDRLTNKIIVPITDYEGNIINVSARTLDPEFKKKGIPKYIYYEAIGSMNTLFAYAMHKDFIRQANQMIIFEGAKSVMKAETWGYMNCVAILTSHLSEGQANFLLKLGIPLVFALDEDVDVIEDKNIKKLSHYLNIEYVYDFDRLLDKKMSPVDKGKEVFEKLMNERRILS